MKGEAKRRWGKLTDNDLTEIEGNYDKLAGRLQELYGKSQEEIEREIDELCSAEGRKKPPVTARTR